MRHLIQSENGSLAIDCNYIEAARQRLEEMRTNKASLPEPPTISELEEALSEPVQKCELLAKNWRNRIYRVELRSGAAVVAKQIIWGTDAMLQYQYDQLGALARLEIPGLRLPKALALLRAKRTFVMEFGHGKTIRALAWSGTSADDLLPVCELAGKILARIHMAWTQKIAPLPVELLARDFAAAPWHLSTREQRILKSALGTLAKAEVSMGQVYYDYKPANLLFANDELFLIDPPDVLQQGVHLWDFSRFRGDMRRLLWRLSLRRPFDRRRALVRQTMATFECGYLESFNKRHPEPALFASVARLFELQHTALSITMQKEKLDLFRERTKPGSGRRLRDSRANLTTLPLLEIEKRWLFRQLARELPL
jgi:hypothetical protein